MSISMTDALADRYLRLLGVEPEPPGFDALARLSAAHLDRFPFENISKLYYRRQPDRRLPSLEQFLDGAERFHFGGTCYATAFSFHQLLVHLGYDVTLCGADMAEPDVHLVNVVMLDDEPFLVDVGFAAPFLSPLLLCADKDHEFVWGNEYYVLRRRDADGRSSLECLRDGRPTQGYSLTCVPRRIAEFEGVIARSFDPGATFMRRLTAVRFSAAGSTSIRDLIVTSTTDGATTVSTLAGAADLPRAIEERFGIPASITRDVVADLIAAGVSFG